MNKRYDIIVVGGGHAGCEAAVAAANMGSSVLLVTMDFGGLARMSCNPAIGGIAKGQIVREIDALGGFTGIVTDASTLQFRMLNRSKGPAMWSPRAQCDKIQFSLNWRKIIETTCRLDVYIDSVTSFLFEDLKIAGVCTTTGAIFNSQAVIVTAGTFLNGKLFIGRNEFEGGRIGEKSSYGLTQQLSERGVKTFRMKTGTPPRIDISSLDLSKMTIQEGDQNPDKFSFLPFLSTVQNGTPQMPCYIIHTNSVVHDILKSGFSESPMFTGMIQGKGPRYCPSIEDKLRVFPDKDSHQLFIEPEGRNTNEYYIQGFSSSLPLTVQMEALHNLEGFEDVKVYKPAYAVEYDYFDPLQLNATLESKKIENLFLAGQVNGTTGYEEAAAQGLMAGINAHLKVKEKEPFVLRRDQSYIGVLIDDLITKGVDEPYRMFTSRAEYRILLRQDNADFRLTELSYNLGLADEFRYELTMSKYDAFDRLKTFSESVNLKPESVNNYLARIGETLISEPKKISDLVARPTVNLSILLSFVPRGTFSKISDFKNAFLKQAILNNKESYAKLLSLNSFSEIENFIKSLLLYNSNKSLIAALYILKFNCGFPLPDLINADNIIFETFNSLLLEAVEISIKYKGYIDREQLIADKIKRLESLEIPVNFDYGRVAGLSIECRQKFEKYSPRTVAQASRISGVSPSDISILLLFFGR